MFPSENTPQTAALERPEARGWEAMDRTSGRRVASPAAPPVPFPSWRAAAGRALGLARAFLLLEDPAPEVQPTSPRVPAGAPAHPHRQPLRSDLRSRRPGAAAPREQHCLTPVTRPSSRSSRVPGWQLR
ncbi:MAG TPA: hypothetical protein VFR97_07850 [Capillimicrobium sp.]|nr:hypothetical protein [Capillimicrobium sp.]